MLQIGNRTDSTTRGIDMKDINAVGHDTAIAEPRRGAYCRAALQQAHNDDTMT